MHCAAAAVRISALCSKYVDKLIAERAFQNLKGLIYFTDGYGTFPKRRPPYDAAFVFYHEDYTDVGVPPWAMKLILGERGFVLGTAVSWALGG